MVEPVQLDPPADLPITFNAQVMAEPLLCPHCAESVDAFDHFCPHCGKPITSHASNDPFGQIFSTGQLYYNATHGSRYRRPSRIVALGIWLIFGPTQIVLTFGLVILLRDWFLSPHSIFQAGDSFDLHIGGSNGPSTPPWLSLLILSACWLVNGLILYRVTVPHMRWRKHLARKNARRRAAGEAKLHANARRY